MTSITEFRAVHPEFDWTFQGFPLAGDYGDWELRSSFTLYGIQYGCLWKLTSKEDLALKMAEIKAYTYPDDAQKPEHVVKNLPEHANLDQS